MVPADTGQTDGRAPRSLQPVQAVHARLPVPSPSGIAGPYEARPCWVVLPVQECFYQHSPAETQMALLPSKLPLDCLPSVLLLSTDLDLSSTVVGPTYPFFLNY